MTNEEYLHQAITNVFAVIGVFAFIIGVISLIVYFIGLSIQRGSERRAAIWNQYKALQAIEEAKEREKKEKTPIIEGEKKGSKKKSSK